MVKYYGDTDDPMWQVEVEHLFPWFYGKGVDIGAGARSINKDILRVDIDKKVSPDILASGDNLPFKNGEFDYLCSIHSFEHFEDQKKTLTEWLRVVKDGGIIGIVHPDVTFTKQKNFEEGSKALKEDPHNKHYHEYTPETFIKMLQGWPDLPFKVMDFGVACPDWSFFVILKKT
jgi:predicted SAM-dependent methyltransferase